MRPQFLVVAVIVTGVVFRLCVNCRHIVTAVFKVSSEQNTVDIELCRFTFVHW